MITLEQAIDLLRATTIRLETERVGLNDCLYRVLREDIVSDIDMPPFDKSAVDGYACRMQDLSNSLEVIEVIPAGSPPVRSVGPNQCSKIMTGAMMPAGADCVVMVEHTESTALNTIRCTRDTTAVNICRKGEDVVKGEKLISNGTRITPNKVASLALAGFANPLVSRKPTVGIIATGDEIVEPSVVPQLSQIRNSNSPQLFAQILEFGCIPRPYGIVKDSQQAIRAQVAKGSEENDLLILTGGVSMGDLDFVPAILEQEGYQILFRQVAIQPGMPTVFARKGSKFAFGIPGNPVAAFIVFEVIVKELLASMLGLKSFIRCVRCPLSGDIKRQRSGRIGWRPVKMTPDGKAQPVEYHGTAHISAYASAFGIVPIPIGVNEMKQGEFVEVRLI